MPRESSKCREWEKERRNRLNEAFQQLCKLLPCYDPSINTSKIDILRNATKFIEELQEKIKDLTSECNEEKTKKIKNNEIKKLHERLKRLLHKNEQLCCLLRDAKITIPTGCAIIKKFRSHLYWSNRITPEQAKILQEKELGKENTGEKSKIIGNKKKKTNSTPKHRKVIVNRTENKRLKTTKKKKRDNQSTANCLIVLSKQPTVTQSCYVITNAPSNALLENTSTVITNSNLLTTPLVTTNVKNYNNKPVVTTPPTLGPGTLILANGTIVPVLPTQQTLLSTQFLTNNNRVTPNQQNPTVILLPKVTTSLPKSTDSTITTTTTKTLARIKPKYCLTRTTQMNKVPIPALTSRYGNSELVLKKTDDKANKNDKKKVEGTNDIGVKRKSSESNKENDKKAKIGCNNDQTNQKDTDKNPETNQQLHKNVEKIKEKNQENEEKITKNLSETDGNCTENPPVSSTITTITTTVSTIESAPIPTAIVEETTNCGDDKREIAEDLGDDKGLEQNSNEMHNEQITSTVVTTTTTTTTVDAMVAPSKTTTVATTTTTQQQDIRSLELNINHSELSNDIFATLQVPSGCQNPESTSPTAAFLLAFPLVSSLTGVKVTEVTEEDNTVESQRGTTPTTLLQIGTIDTTTKQPTTQSSDNNLTPSLLNLDNLSFFTSNNLYNYDNTTNITTTTTTTTVTTSSGNNRAVLTDCQLKTTAPSTLATTITTSKKNYSNCFNQTKTNYNYNNFDDLTTKITSYSTIIKNYPDPLYTNSNTYNYNYNDNQNYYKNITKSDNRNYYSLNYENYTDYRKNDLNFNATYYNTATTTTTTTTTPTQFTKEKFTSNSGRVKNDRAPINWMTTPNNYGLPQFNKESDIYTTNSFATMPTPATTTTTTQSYFNPIHQNTNNLTNPNNGSSNNNNNNNVNNNQESRKNLDLNLNYHHSHHHSYQQKNDIDDNQFSWSPTKLPQFFEPTTHSFVTSTLPTLVGDLSLNNSLNFLNESKTDQINRFNTKKDNRRPNHNHNKTYENQSNFLSVSQLVDHNKHDNSNHNNNNNMPARTANRRNSGNRASKKHSQQQQQQQQQQKSRTSGGNNKDKEHNNKNQLKQQINYNTTNLQETTNDLFCDNTKNHRNLSKNYSAEALISHQLPQNRQNYPVTTTTTNKLSVPPPFLPDNPILPYFPSVDLQSTQDNNYMQQNQNYSHHHHHQTFGHNFSSSFQNNNYASNGFIAPPPPAPPPPPPSTTTYLPTNSFMHDMGTTHDYTDLNLFPTTSTTITTTTSSITLNKEKSYNKNRIIGNNQQNICPISTAFVNNHNNGNINNNGSISNNNNNGNNNNNKRRKKHNNDMNTNLPGFVDFSFFSMPGTINSPILPDDFHTHTGFLPTPTPQLYPCKNPLYTKQSDLTTSTLLPPPLPPVPSNSNNVTNNNNGVGNNNRSNVQHPEISPSINNVGTSLTNFNLSTIFPEINNKGVLSEPYLEPKIKDHRNYNSTVQVSFNDKPTFSFSYINSTSQSYNNQQ